MSGELLPCPLCKGPAELDRYSPFRHYRTGEPLEQVSVYCTQCSLSLSWYPRDLDLDRDQTAEFVTEQWNHRPRAPLQPKDTEQ